MHALHICQADTRMVASTVCCWPPIWVPASVLRCSRPDCSLPQLQLRKRPDPSSSRCWLNGESGSAPRSLTSLSAGLVTNGESCAACGAGRELLCLIVTVLCRTPCSMPCIACAEPGLKHWKGLGVACGKHIGKGGRCCNSAARSARVVARDAHLHAICVWKCSPGRPSHVFQSGGVHDTEAPASMPLRVALLLVGMERKMDVLGAARGAGQAHGGTWTPASQVGFVRMSAQGWGISSHWRLHARGVALPPAHPPPTPTTFIL